MPRPAFASVDEYLASMPETTQSVLGTVRAAIRRALPGAQEAISYGIPAYKIDGRVVIYFAGFKEHYSVFPANARLVAHFARDLAPYEFNNKGTIRFPLSARVPVGLIGAIAKFLARDAAARHVAKRSPRKKR